MFRFLKCTESPFIYKGQNVRVTIGLGDKIGANTILGITFIKAARMTMLFDEADTVVSGVLNHQFKITYQVPTRSEIAPTIGIDQEAVLLTTVSGPGR